MQRINNLILRLALKGRGYNIGCNPDQSGEEKFINLVARHNPRLCLDIGANKGLYSALLLASSTTKVVAFDPLPSATDMLSELSEKYKDRFTLINKGVGKESSFLTFYYGDNTEHSSFSEEINEIESVRKNNTHTKQVEVITLDDFFSDFSCNEIDLIKIDTEGFEYEVLAGATKTIAEKRPKFIQIEHNIHQLFKSHPLYKIASLLPGYNVYQLLPYGCGYVKRDAKSPESNIFEYSNFIFVRGDIQI
jgi:FkbM family methyltransferase